MVISLQQSWAKTIVAPVMSVWGVYYAWQKAQLDRCSRCRPRPLSLSNYLSLCGCYTFARKFQALSSPEDYSFRVDLNPRRVPGFPLLRQIPRVSRRGDEAGVGMEAAYGE